MEMEEKQWKIINIRGMFQLFQASTSYTCKFLYISMPPIQETDTYVYRSNCALLDRIGTEMQ
jgi:hypothetical protein